MYTRGSCFAVVQLTKFLREGGWLDAAVRRRVPQYSAHTREEWKEWCNVWPMAWKPPPVASVDATGKPLLEVHVKVVLCQCCSSVSLDCSSHHEF